MDSLEVSNYHFTILGFPQESIHDCYLWHQHTPTMLRGCGASEEQFATQLLELLGRSFHWGICNAAGEVVGIFMIEPVYQPYSNEIRDGQIHVALARKSWGKGVMQQIVPAIFKAMFTALPGLLRLTAWILDNNAPSIAITKFMGFRLEGVQREAIRLEDRVHDLHMYGLTREEYETKFGSGE